MVCCFGLAFTDFSKKRFLLRSETITTRIIIAGQGVLLLVYPLLGHLADVYLTRYRVLKASLIILTTITITNLVYLATDAATSTFTESMIFHHTTASPLFAYIIIMYMIGVGLYEAKIVQFGLDQLLEAPTTKLISFINWYYWVQSVGELVQFYVYESDQVGQMTVLESYHGTTAKILVNNIPESIFNVSAVMLNIIMLMHFKEILLHS